MNIQSKILYLTISNSNTYPENALLKMHQTKYVLMKDQLCQIRNSFTKKNLGSKFSDYHN